MIEGDDGRLWVGKFRGAGQGAAALVAEVIVGELARALGFALPELVVVELDAALGAAEPDPEIQDLIAASAGANLGVDFLPGALAFDAATARGLDPAWAAGVVWLDALVTNVDRTPRNPNLLRWHGRTWLIDHGAALYLQHGADDLPALAERPFPAIAEHVLLPFAGSVAEAHQRLAPRARDALEPAGAAVPADWLPDGDVTPYVAYLRRRLEWGGFAEEADRVRP